MYKLAISLTSMYLSELTFGINRFINKCHKNRISCDVVGFVAGTMSPENNIPFHSAMLTITSGEEIKCFEKFHYNLDSDTLDF